MDDHEAEDTGHHKKSVAREREISARTRIDRTRRNRTEKVQAVCIDCADEQLNVEDRRAEGHRADTCQESTCEGGPAPRGEHRNQRHDDRADGSEESGGSKSPRRVDPAATPDSDDGTGCHSDGTEQSDYRREWRPGLHSGVVDTRLRRSSRCCGHSIDGSA